MSFRVAMFLAVGVLATVWVYNRFIAEKGKTIANFGEPKV